MYTRFLKNASQVFKNFTFFSRKGPAGGVMPQPSGPPQNYEYYEDYEHCAGGIFHRRPVLAACDPCASSADRQPARRAKPCFYDRIFKKALEKTVKQM